LPLASKGTLATKGGPSIIINRTSSAHRGTEIDLGEIREGKKYSGYHAYIQSKLAKALSTNQLADSRRCGVTVNRLHTGVVRNGFGKGRGRDEKMPDPRFPYLMVVLMA
jgi:hypothetical protein